MAGILPGDPSHHGMVEGSPYSFSQDLSEEGDRIGSSWYLSRKEIEENSPSREDGIDLKKEAYFLEETPRPLKDVILVSYEIIHKRDPAAVQRIKQKEVYEQQKEIILLGERAVLATLAFDFNVNHPYKPLVEAIKKFKVAQNALAQVAWNFVNDGLRTSLCLQFKSHHIAAGAIFLAAKFLKVKLPSDGDKVWWQEFDVTPRQLEEVSNQMLELYEQNRTMASHANETEGSSASGANHRAPMRAILSLEETPPPNVPVGTSTSQRGVHINSSAQPGPDRRTDEQIGTQRTVQNESSDHEGKGTRSGLADHKVGGTKDRWHHESGNIAEAQTSRSTHESESIIEEPGRTSETREKNSGYSEGPKDYSPLDAIKMLDKDKVKAALEKRRKARGEVARKIDVMDDDDLIERELESGIEIAAKEEENRQSRSKPSYRQEIHKPDHGIEDGDFGTGNESENAEEGEFHSPPETGSRKRRAASPIKLPARKEGYDHQHHHQSSSKHRDVDDSLVMGRLECERDHKRLRQGNHLG